MQNRGRLEDSKRKAEEGGHRDNHGRGRQQKSAGGLQKCGDKITLIQI